MYQIIKPIFLLAETPVHAGSGSDLGYIDNPIQREKHTGYPKIESSSLKGALRHAFEAKINSKSFAAFESDDVKIHRIFGYDEDSLNDTQKSALKNALKDKKGDEQKDFAGAIGFTDARILLFPVKSLKGTFAYVTCPRVLAKFKKELEEVCKRDLTGISFPTEAGTSSSKLEIAKDKIQLDEYIYDNFGIKTEITAFAKWLQDNVFPKNGLNIVSVAENLVVVENDDFADFVKFGTEVSTHIKIDNETGTVKDGALFTVEYLPSETVMYSLVMFSPEFRNEGMKESIVEGFFTTNKPDYFQLGGNATLGKGVLNLQVPILQTKKEEA